ncbi:MAG: hypothetical protein AB1Z16_12635, partial [Desulfotignum sp.]
FWNATAPKCISINQSHHGGSIFNNQLFLKRNLKVRNNYQKAYQRLAQLVLMLRNSLIHMGKQTIRKTI